MDLSAVKPYSIKVEETMLRRRLNQQRLPQKPRMKVAPSALAAAKLAKFGGVIGKRSRGAATETSEPFFPPEKWYEPTENDSDEYRVITQSPGRGYRHAVTEAQIRQRLDQLPDWMLKPLDFLQLSSMTRKKDTFPCYGMQWGSTLYLYPIEESLVEYFPIPPKPSIYNETRMYGGRWVQQSGSAWNLMWSKQSLRDFYLNNILIHELGHLLDERNTSYTDRERFAEWFALEHGYKASDRATLARRAASRTFRKRHHST
jgi:hypothetical protein